ncbi:hypothetical protein J0695_39795, partial [Streptomyces beijiangensis]|nr:hypothetical protein [Streptomyces beijiangensis]
VLGLLGVPGELLPGAGELAGGVPGVPGVERGELELASGVLVPGVLPVGGGVERGGVLDGLLDGVDDVCDGFVVGDVVGVALVPVGADDRGVEGDVEDGVEAAGPLEEGEDGVEGVALGPGVELVECDGTDGVDGEGDDGDGVRPDGVGPVLGREPGVLELEPPEFGLVGIALFPSGRAFDGPSEALGVGFA